MNAVTPVIGAVAALAVGLASVILGVNLLPPRETVQEAGTLIPWLVAWGMVLGTMLVALILAAYLVASARSTRHPD